MILAHLMDVPIYMSPEVVAEAGRDPRSLVETSEGDLEIANEQGDIPSAESEKDAVPSESLPESMVEAAPDIPDIKEDDSVHLAEPEPQQKIGIRTGRGGVIREPSELEKLETHLERLVAEELYEEAAKVRDHITLIRSRQ